MRDVTKFGAQAKMSNCDPLEQARCWKVFFSGQQTPTEDQSVRANQISDPSRIDSNGGDND
jgi:hypothetical protein